MSKAQRDLIWGDFYQQKESTFFGTSRINLSLLEENVDTYQEDNSQQWAVSENKKPTFTKIYFEYGRYRSEDIQCVTHTNWISNSKQHAEYTKRHFDTSLRKNTSKQQGTNLLTKSLLLIKSINSHEKKMAPLFGETKKMYIINKDFSSLCKKVHDVVSKNHCFKLKLWIR